MISEELKTNAKEVMGDPFVTSFREKINDVVNGKHSIKSAIHYTAMLEMYINLTGRSEECDEFIVWVNDEWQREKDEVSEFSQQTHEDGASVEKALADLGYKTDRTTGCAVDDKSHVKLVK